MKRRVWGEILKVTLILWWISGPVASASAAEIIELNEANNVGYFSVHIGTPPAGPDLTAEGVISPQHHVGSPSGSWDLAYRILSMSAAGSTVAPSTAGIFASFDPVFSEDDFLLETVAIPALNSGEYVEGSTPISLPGGFADGTYLWVLIVADVFDDILELNEENNVSSYSLHIGTPPAGADLTTEGVKSPQHHVGSPSGSWDVSYRILSMSPGGSMVAPSTAGIYASFDRFLSGDDHLLETVSIPTLSPGEFVEESTTVSVPAGFADGTYLWILIVADMPSANELNEANNVGYFSVHIGTPPAGPDLTAEGVISPQHHVGSPSGSWDLAYRILSMSVAGSMVAPSTVGIFASFDPVFSGDDFLLATVAIPALSSGEYVEGNTPISLPGGFADGTYLWVLIVADVFDDIVELNEENNVNSYSLHIGTPPAGADLTTEGIISPQHHVGSPSGSWDLTYRILSMSVAGSTAPASTAGIYASFDRFLSGDDVLLETVSIPSLSSGEFVEESTNISLPAGYSDGTYLYVLVAADISGGLFVDGFESGSTNVWSSTVP